MSLSPRTITPHLKNITPTRIRNLGQLRRGDRIEARFTGEAPVRGRVEDTAPGIGVLWIREKAGAPRMSISTEDYSIWHLPVA